MKKLTLALLLLASTSSFAQNNELAFSVGYMNYKATGVSNPFVNFTHNLEGQGYQFSAYYLRNIKWLQLGGGFETGWTNSNSFPVVYLPQQRSQKSVTATNKETIAAPFINPTVLVNFRLPVGQFTFYAGGAGGYFSARGNHHMDFHNGGVDFDNTYVTSGFSAGGQAGVTYKLSSNFALAADASARFIRLRDNAVEPFVPTVGHTTRPSLSYYSFSIGARYLL